MDQVCLFAHFDQDNRIDDYVRYYLRNIKQLGFSIVFISSSQLYDADLEQLRADCHDIILRENAGFDFGSWSAGLAKYRDSINGRLLLANDSVYGPIGNLAKALDRLIRTPADFYGMVESIEATPHLQSWFLLFEPWVIKSKEFVTILNQPFHKMTKAQIIESGELALSRQLVASGFRYEALFRNDRAHLMSQRHIANPMLLFWRELLLMEGVPFLKVELLRDNPIEVEDAETILRVVEMIDPTLFQVIKSHTTRTAHRKTSFQRPFLSRRKYALIRQRYRLQQDGRRFAGVWNSFKLESLSAILNRWRIFRDHFRRP
jgi:lipopolysaccharide biosynthesis protein